jgi:uncharacterized protein with GYD domain
MPDDVADGIKQRDAAAKQLTETTAGRVHDVYVYLIHHDVIVTL